MAHTQNQDEEITGINVTPLVDVMLVLLIIFMVTTSYIVHQAIQVQLPKATSGEAASTTHLAFVLDKNSQLYLDGVPLALEAQSLEEAIQKKKKDPSSPLQALVSADQETPYRSVVKAIDLIRQSGISDFALNIEVQAP
jgi:biopolymer transport protein TolR